MTVEYAAMQRVAVALIGGALAVVAALVALLVSDALSPGRLSPMLAFYAASGSGLALIAGLVLLERSSRRERWVHGMPG